MQWLQTQERMSWFTEVAILLLLFTPSGNATQFCPSNTTLDFSQCENVAIAMLRTIADELFPNVTVVDDETLAMALDIVNDLANLTQPTNCSIFPRDINTSNYIITNTVDFLYMHLDQGGATDITASAGVVEVIDNLLDWVNLAGFEDLQAGAPGSQSVLNNAERYALYLATALSQNGSERDILLSRQNIVIRSERLETNDTQLTDVIFPLDGDLQNFTISSGMSPAVITVPAQLMVQRTNSSTVAIAHIQFQNLQDFLPPELDNSLATPVSLIISSQVAVQSGGSMSSQTLEENPVMITFTVDGATDEDFTCVFWDFSEPIGSGGWSTEGVTAVQVMQDGNNTVVQCNSTHLTSFAVLRVMAGTAVNGPRRLRVIGYIGMAVSLACLLLTIIFFLSLGKKLFKEVHNFVHLNLAIALFVGYLTFCLGVELAATNKAACQTVSAIMQYFFLASFCWVLCEGIMSYLLLVLVFSSLSKQWWFFLILGWIPPIFFVVIGLATVLDEYVVYSRNGAGEILTDRDGNDIIRFCWLSAGNGTTAIWTFVAPILAIFVISCVFLILVLCSLYRYHRNRSSELKENRSRVKLAVLLKATIILFPLLGLTWVLGIFVVNLNTQDVAVSVTVFNSLQGVFIFFLHVLRSERVWGRIKKKYHSSKHSKAGTHV